MNITLLLITSALLAQTPPVKTAGEAFKNVTQLKDAPADQLMPSMQLMSIALGVECTYCHVQGKMDADDKPAKKTAREMIAMTMEINKTRFASRVQVSCYSCHRGAERPVGTPPVLESDALAAAKPSPVATPPSASASTVDQVLDKYVAALGGADAIRKINSRIMKGSIMSGGSKTSIEIVTKAPNKRITITHAASGDSYTAFDGTIGWMGGAGRPGREMSATDALAFSLDAEFYLPLRLKELYPQMHMGRPETVEGVACETLIATAAAGRPPLRLNFDKSTGLLLRMTRSAETPVGRNPTRIDYSDYRAVDGVKTPFRWTLSRPNGRFTIQVDNVTNNTPVEDSRFAKTAAQ